MVTPLFIVSSPTTFNPTLQVEERQLDAYLFCFLNMTWREWMMHRSSCLIAATAAILTCTGATRADAPAQRIVVQNYYYALPGKATEVYELRLRASDVRASLGLPRGRVLRRTGDPGSSADLPDVIWECEYPSIAARESDVAALDRSQQFELVEKRMDSLLQRFKRAQFTISGE